MKRLIAVLLTMLFSCICVTAFSNGATYNYSFGQEINYGNTLFNTNVVRGAVTFEDGKPIGLCVVPGSTTYLNVVDLQSKQLKKAIPLPGETSTAWQMERAANGDVYFGTYIKTKLYRYSPQTKNVHDLGRIASEGALMSMAFGEEGELYLGTYPSAKIFKYDIGAATLTDYGNRKIGEQYLSAMGYYNGYLYYVTMNEGQSLKKFNPATQTETNIPLPADINGISRIFVRGNYLFAFANSTVNGSVMLVFNLVTEQFTTDIIKNPLGVAMSPVLDNKVYFNKDYYVYSFNLSTGAFAYLSGMPKVGVFRGDGWITIDDEGFAGPNYVNFGYTGEISILNFQTKNVHVIQDVLQGTESETRAYTFGPDGRLYIGEYMGTKAAALDIETGDIEYFHMAQPESIGVLGDKIYFGNYTDAKLYILDTKKPYSRSYNAQDQQINPRIFGSFGQEQDRPFVNITFEDKVVFGSIPTYGKLGGAVTVYNTQTDTLDVYRHLVPNQSIISLAYANGKLYAGTSVSGGLGIYPTEQRAVVFEFDMATRTKTRELTVIVPGISADIKAVQGMTIVDDNTLLCTARGITFKVDLNTFAMTDHIITGDYNFYDGTQLWRPVNMNVDPITGKVFYSPNSTLLILNPQTLQYTNTNLAVPTSAVWGPNNNLFYINSAFEVVELPIVRSLHSVRDGNELLLEGNIISLRVRRDAHTETYIAQYEKVGNSNILRSLQRHPMAVRKDEWASFETVLPIKKANQVIKIFALESLYLQPLTEPLLP